MAKQKHTVEQIIQKLREVEIALGRGQSIADPTREAGFFEGGARDARPWHPSRPKPLP